MEGEGVEVGQQGEPGQLAEAGDLVAVQVEHLQIGEPAPGYRQYIAASSWVPFTKNLHEMFIVWVGSFRFLLDFFYVDPKPYTSHYA